MRPHEAEDLALFEVVHRGEWAQNGFRNKDLRPLLFGDEAGLPPEEIRRRSGRMTRRLRLLRAHGLIRKMPHSHCYRLTPKGHDTISAILAARQTPIRDLLARAA